VSKKFLEDIIDKEKDNNKGLTQGKIRKFLDVVTSNPVKTTIATYAGLVLVSQATDDTGIDKVVEGFPIIAYSEYLLLGLAKDYFLKEKKFMELKDVNSLYTWFLNNPKAAALLGAGLGGLAAGFSQFKLLEDLYGLDINPIELVPNLEQTAQQLRVSNSITNRIEAGVTLGGILTEVISKGLKNLRKIKKNQSNKPLVERIWDLTFEHPFIIAALTTAYTTYSMYEGTVERYQKINPNTKILTGDFAQDVMSDPINLAGLLMQSTIAAWLTIGGIIGTGAVLHSTSLKEIYFRARKNIAKLADKKDQAIEYQRKVTELPSSLERKIEDIVELGNMNYERNEDKKTAMSYYAKALRLFTSKSDRETYTSLVSKAFRLDKFGRFLTKLRKTKDTEDDKINRMFIKLLNKDQEALDEIKSLAAENDPRFRYLYGKALIAAGYPKSGKFQIQKAVEDKLREGNTELVDESKNTIVLFKEDLFEEEVIGKCADKKNLEREKEVTEDLAVKISDIEDRYVPFPIAIVERDGRFIYIMERSSGKTLAQKIKEGTASKEDFQNVAEFMGILHAYLPKENKEERKYGERIKYDLERIGLVERAKEISEALEPAIKSLEGIVRVCNKDGHPRNWMILETGEIIAIDLEADSLIPLTIDTANEVSQYSQPREEIKYEILDEHIKSFRRITGIKISQEQYQLAFLNSVVIRAFEIYPQVKDKNPEIKTVSLDNARKAIAKMKQDFPEHYEGNKQKYDSLDRNAELLKAA